MRKFFTVLVAGIIAFSASAFAATKIDPHFNYIKSQKGRMSLDELTTKMVGVKAAGNVVLVDAIIKTSDPDIVGAAVEDLGGSIGAIFQTVMTAKIPLDAVDKLAEMNEVDYISASKPLRQKMNVARDNGITNVVSVQQGTGLPQAYNGDGVVVGIIDSGVDCAHPDFFDASGNSRIIAFKNSSGTEYSATQIASGVCTDSNVHGTHVAGIAAGDDSTYKGVAPNSWIVAYKLGISSTETTVLEGIEYIFQKAQARLAPAVVNISLGTSLGPHDNTSLFEKGLTEAVNGKQGRVLICAAGNETVVPGDVELGFTLGGLHAPVNVAGGAAKGQGFQTIIRETNSERHFIIDVWLNAGGQCTIEMDVFNNVGTRIINMSGVPAGGSNIDSPETAGNISAYVDFTDDNNANNGKQHAQVVLEYSGSSPHNPTSLTYDLIFKDAGGAGCVGDAWLYIDLVRDNVFTVKAGDSADGTYSYSSGDSNKMVTIPSTSTGCISVASYASRPTWVDKDGVTHNQDVYDPNIGAFGTPASDISVFSSHGPGAGATNLQKPDITAPGEPIISTLNSGCDTATCLNSVIGPTVADVEKRVADSSFRHLKLEGTSMASPFIAGVVALLFQKNGCLSYSDIKSALTSNVITDAFTGAVPNYLWGYGKVDALAAINGIASSDCQPDNPGDNTAGGKSGCSLLAHSGHGGSADTITIVLSVLIISMLFGLLIFFKKKVSRRVD